VNKDEFTYTMGLNKAITMSRGKGDTASQWKMAISGVLELFND